MLTATLLDAPFSKAMTEQDSKRYYITLSAEEVAEVEQLAKQQSIPVAHVIRDRYRQQVQPQTYLDAQTNHQRIGSISEHLTRSDESSSKSSALPQATINATTDQSVNQMERMRVELGELRREVQQLVEDGILIQPSIEPYVRTALQPIHHRLEQVETNIAQVSKLLVQAIERLGELSQVIGRDRTQIPIHFLRLEACLEVLHILNQRQLIALTPEEDRSQEQSFLDEVRTQLQQYLEKDGRLDR